jgi:D-tyrosyl-tRNA(Tyr) deacylase
MGVLGLVAFGQEVDPRPPDGFNGAAAPELRGGEEAMRAVVQRVSQAEVAVAGQVVGRIGRGLLVLACAMAGDTHEDVRWLAGRLLPLRIFPDAQGKMNRALPDLAADGEAVGILVVSQFTLAADLGPGQSKGNRPFFGNSMAPDAAAAQVDALVEALVALSRGAPGITVATGRFAADMAVSLTNDGPVTLWLDSRGRGASA